MLKADYNRAVALCKASIDGGFDLTPRHTSAKNLPFDATHTLRQQMFSRHTRKVDRRCKQRTGELISQYRKGSRIADIARQPGLRFSPYILARIFVGALELGVQQEPGSTLSEAERKKRAKQISRLMCTPSLISDDRLRREVEDCISEDGDNSPHMDRVRRGLGAEYEFILLQKLRARGVAFESESDLRKKGEHKTPDALLQVPMAVKGPTNKWMMVTWIDSKAMFGDEDTYKDHQEQLLGYVNRYGPGLVIYFFGFTETLVSPKFDGYKKDIMVKADFPSPIMLPDAQIL